MSQINLNRYEKAEYFIAVNHLYRNSLPINYQRLGLWAAGWGLLSGLCAYKGWLSKPTAVILFGAGSSLPLLANWAIPSYLRSKANVPDSFLEESHKSMGKAHTWMPPGLKKVAELRQEAVTSRMRREHEQVVENCELAALPEIPPSQPPLPTHAVASLEKLKGEGESSQFDVELIGIVESWAQVFLKERVLVADPIARSPQYNTAVSHLVWVLNSSRTPRAKKGPTRQL
ncbi:MAG: hypothetical protein AB7F31_04395 [Parachlamydiales bacterium]